MGLTITRFLKMESLHDLEITISGQSRNITCHYVRGDHSIDTVYGITRKIGRTIMIGDSPCLWTRMVTLLYGA
jgi:hypothetical protein